MDEYLNTLKKESQKIKLGEISPYNVAVTTLALVRVKAHQIGNRHVAGQAFVELKAWLDTLIANHSQDRGIS